MGVGYLSRVSWEIVFWGGTGAAFTGLYFVGSWIGLVGSLGYLGNGEGHRCQLA